MDKTLADLIKISNTVGKDNSLVQGGGGNTSAKTPDGKQMYIKASGTALKDMDGQRGWRRMNVDSVLDVLADQELPGMETNEREDEVTRRLLRCCDDGLGKTSRPSVEAPLHAMLDQYVVHLHPWAVGAYVNANDGQARLEKLFKDEKYPPLWVPYTDPGFLLAQKVEKLVKAYQEEHGRKPTIIFLDKHGLFVSGSSLRVVALVRKVIAICEQRIKSVAAKRLKDADADLVWEAQLGIRSGYFKATGQYINVRFASNEIIQGFDKRRDADKLLAPAALTPDELVYANGGPVYLKKTDADFVAKRIEKLVAQGRKTPASFFVPDLGLFIAADEPTADIIEQVSTGSMYMRAAAANFSGVRALTKREQDFIKNWEAESFRKNLSGGGTTGTLEQRIAIVTGAGSGLGRSIAVGLARAGAQVALADIDLAAAEQTQVMINEELPRANVMPVACNVTDENSVAEAFEDLVYAWGGLDILVNAAGVAPAFPLVDLPVDKWRFALEVNLTGYFLMAQAAARIMIEQGMGGSIVNISSKSGIDASKNNTPYNATKAGELHMARGWAMELGGDGIRVNCVCPGNVFEGSKIWNPDYIKVCAKKYGIKPEEVIPFYVSKTVLGREIKGQDIADSVVFLSSDQARTITGQVIVADCGQAMVR